MKKVLLILSMVFVAVMAHAQMDPIDANGYIKNSSFGYNDWKSTCGVTTTTINNSSFTRPGIEPNNWNGSNVTQILNFSDFVTKGGNDADGTCLLTNQKPGALGVSSPAPAFLTFGTPWIFADTGKTGGNGLSLGDGGVYGGVNFSHKPDAISFKYKRSEAKGNEDAYVIAYIWNGIYKSTARSAIEKTGGNWLKPVYSESATVELEDMDRAVMGKSTTTVNTATSTGKRIASLEYKITETTSDWVTVTAPFTYDAENKTEDPAKMNLIVCASDYWTRGNIVPYNTLEVDDIQFIYYKELKSLTINGDGTLFPAFDPNVTEYTYKGKYESFLAETKSEWATFASTYVDNVLTITVTGNDGLTKNYVVNVVPDAQDVAGDYMSKITVFYGEGTATVNSVKITANDDNTVNFILNDFTFSGQVVGDITLNNVVIAWNGDDISLATSQNVTIDGPSTDLLNLKDMPLEMSGLYNLTTDVLTATLNVNWTAPAGGTTTILVTVEEAPFTYTIDGKVMTVNGGAINTDDYILYYTAQSMGVNVLDLTAVEVTQSADLPTIVEVLNLDFGNAMAYVTSAGIEGTNIINNNVCSSLVISDGAEFNAPYDFTAVTASYTRSFNAAADYVSSFVLPVAVPAANINGTVYELVGYEDGVLNFAEVTTTLEANKPYIVKATSANLLNDANNVSVAATTEATLENAVSGGAVHVGSYTSQPVASDASTSYYGYKGGTFVKANTGTLNPFRTMIKVSGQQTLSTLALSFDGEVTGIGSIIDGELQLNGTVDVYDLNGRLVHQGAKAASSLQGLPAGVYVVNGQKVVVK